MRKSMFFILSLVLLLLLPGKSSISKGEITIDAKPSDITRQASTRSTCCGRQVGTLPIAGADTATSNMIILTWNGRLIEPAIITQCPLVVDFMDIEGAENLNRLLDAMIEAATKKKLDPNRRGAKALDSLNYQFLGRLAVNPDTKLCTLSMKLYDPHHGATVREGATSWTADDLYGPFNPAGRTAIRELAATFAPINKTIYDYERIPHSCTVRPEKEQVKAGEEINIDVSRIVDAEQRTSKSWQRIIVKAEKGQILNGEDREEFKVFEVGTGTVQVKYKAPQVCQQEKETIYVYNSCEMEPRNPANIEAQIGTKEFTLQPGEADGELEIKGHVIMTTKDMSVEVKSHGRIPFTIHWDQQPPTIEGKGKLPYWTQANDCRASFEEKVSLTGKILGTTPKNRKIFFELHEQEVTEIVKCETDVFFFHKMLSGSSKMGQMPLVDGYTIKSTMPPQYVAALEAAGARDGLKVVNVMTTHILHIPCLKKK